MAGLYILRCGCDDPTYVITSGAQYGRRPIYCGECEGEFLTFEAPAFEQEPAAFLGFIIPGLYDDEDEAAKVG